MKKINLEKLIKKMVTVTGGTPESYTGIQNDTTFMVSGEHIRQITEILVSEFDCSHLSGITAQQREGQMDVIEVIYHFWKGIGFSFLMVLPFDARELPSIQHILPGADFYEREAAEMFGIKFAGRNETPPLLLPDDWSEGPPFIRKEERDD